MFVIIDGGDGDDDVVVVAIAAAVAAAAKRNRYQISVLNWANMNFKLDHLFLMLYFVELIALPFIYR